MKSEPEDLGMVGRGERPSERAILVRALGSWLFHGPIRLPSGAYLSWAGGDGAGGFAYPEATAIALRTAVWWARRVGSLDTPPPRGEARPLEQLAPTLHFLNQAVESDGLVRQNGRRYLFDTALVYSAFADAQRCGLHGPYLLAMPRMLAAMVRLVRARKGAEGMGDDRWSSRFGPHLLKALGTLLTSPAMAVNGPEREQVIEAALLLTGMQRDDGAFVHPDDEGVYLHAHCYALEGLAYLEGMLPGEAFGEAFRRGLAFLAGCQHADGTFPHWASGPAAEQACDVTAQAGRLFLVSGNPAHGEALLRAEAALRRFKGPGGMRYSADCGHENSWCTAFSLQLLAGLDRGLAAAEIA